MGAMEKGQEGGGNNSSMPRPPSVDDLFAPMCRLDVQSLGAGLSSSVSAAEGVGWSEAAFGVTRNLVSRIVEKAPTTSSTSGEQPVCTFRERLCLSSWFALVGKVGKFEFLAYDTGYVVCLRCQCGSVHKAEHAKTNTLKSCTRNIYIYIYIDDENVHHLNVRLPRWFSRDIYE